MRNFKGSTWFSIVILVFLSSLATLMLIALLLALSHNIGFVTVVIPQERIPVLFILCISTILGSAVSIFFARNFIRPIRALSSATKRVAKGDFSVQLEYDEGTEIGLLTRDFNTMVRDLGGIETLRSDFVSSVSHEFKTPLAAIEGCAVILQDEDLTLDERRNYTSMIVSNTRRLSVLTTNILRLSKLENQEILPEQTSFSLDEQIRQAILILEAEWEKKNIELDIDLANVSFFGSEEMLMHVWLNLIANAIKFSHDNGKIAIKLRSDGKISRVSIADNGIGMTEEAQSHIFDKFYQADKTHSAEGNGLGLALVKRIVQLCGGIIKVSSEPDKGSVFTVTLPHRA